MPDALYIDAMFRKTGYGLTFTLTSKSHQNAWYCCVSREKNHQQLTGCISWNMLYIPSIIYFIDVFLYVHCEKHICGFV